MPPTKVRTGELRDHLLDVALDILATEGVAGVTTRAVAARARTSAPAIYELFGSKGGLVRALCFEGFGRLVEYLDRLPAPRGAVDDVAATVRSFRQFTTDNPRLFEVMYARPFESFTPGATERELGDRARSILVTRVQRCIDAETLHGDPLDIAHAVLGLSIGLATQETAGWLGSRRAARDRRWDSATKALLRGFET